MAQIYQKQLDALLAQLQTRPTLLLHSCCAPCSSYVLQYLSRYFRILLFYYNPNISPAEEYEKRVREQKRLLEEMGLAEDVTLIEGAYEPQRFFSAVKGLEQAPEGGARCAICFRLRLEQAAQQAVQLGADYFCTTLSISPHKNAALLNEIGESLASKYGVAWLPSDFKKKGGYQASIALSRQYALYRQNYCGCIFSRQQAQEKASCCASPPPLPTAEITDSMDERNF
jgi:predicted adenine nucleotide alpha hydrolase (AANH) superfamily ATPase